MKLLQFIIFLHSYSESKYFFLRIQTKKSKCLAQNWILTTSNVSNFVLIVRISWNFESLQKQKWFSNESSTEFELYFYYLKATSIFYKIKTRILQIKYGESNENELHTTMYYIKILTRSIIENYYVNFKCAISISVRKASIEFKEKLLFVVELYYIPPLTFVWLALSLWNTTYDLWLWKNIVLDG
jgi:hypothetical protein